jgi:TetR/AcrR family transcriptional repressor for divergent bdcA
MLLVSRKLKETKAPRSRRPAFDREHGVEVAQALFHARGYEAVSIADLTQALGVVPPSLYAAYGSKLELFERALRRYVSTDALPVGEILESKQKPAEVLTQLFTAASLHYTRHPEQLGCMVTEAMRADDEQAAAIATALAKKDSELIRNYVSAHAAADDVDRIVDYVHLSLHGLSFHARLGYTGEKLVSCSKTAGRAFATDFEASVAP